MARPRCFVITLADPLWGKQLFSCTGRKGNHPFSEISGKYFFAMWAAIADSKEQRWLKAAQWTNAAGRSRVGGDPPSNPKSTLQSRAVNAPPSSVRLLCLTLATLANPPLRWPGQRGREPPCSRTPHHPPRLVVTEGGPSRGTVAGPCCWPHSVSGRPAPCPCRSISLCWREGQIRWVATEIQGVFTL